MELLETCHLLFRNGIDFEIGQFCTNYSIREKDCGISTNAVYICNIGTRPKRQCLSFLDRSVNNG